MNEPLAHTTQLMQRIISEYTNPVFTSSLSKEDQIITHLIATMEWDVTVVTLDTGRQFNAYYELIDRTQKRYALNLVVVHPDSTALTACIERYGVNGFYASVEARKACCYARKVLPLQQVLTKYDLWITGLRAEQSDHRSAMAVTAFDEAFKIEKFNPLLHWSDADVDTFISEHKVPVNPLHAKGYPSIGCEPCTRPVAPGEHPRSGRWWWEHSKKECGLHQN
jgi:phosphoadenosine phosphosulfate reductase